MLIATGLALFWLRETSGPVEWLSNAYGNHMKWIRTLGLLSTLAVGEPGVHQRVVLLQVRRTPIWIGSDDRPCTYINI